MTTRNNIKKISFHVLVKLEEDKPRFSANIAVFQGVVINIIEPTENATTRQLMILQKEVETYDDGLDSVKINFIEEVDKPDPLIIFNNPEEKNAFVALRNFLQYR
jgi:hypothetical protein